MTNQVQLYQSGFIGKPILDLKPQAGHPIRTVDGMQYVLGYDSRNFTDTLAINHRIDSLRAVLIKDRTSILNFRKRHALLEEIINTMPYVNTNFIQWLELQITSPLMTTIHRQFLEDLFTGLFTGKRVASIHSWGGMLYHTKPQAGLTPQAYSREFRELMRNHGYESWSFASVIARWTSTPDGFSELADAFWLIYGSGATNQ